MNWNNQLLKRFIAWLAPLVEDDYEDQPKPKRVQRTFAIVKHDTLVTITHNAMPGIDTLSVSIRNYHHHRFEYEQRWSRTIKKLIAHTAAAKEDGMNYPIAAALFRIMDGRRPG